MYENDMFKLTEPDNLELFPKNMNKNRVKTFEKRTNKNFYSFVIPFNNNNTINNNQSIVSKNDLMPEVLPSSLLPKDENIR